jgi:aldehyde dehydrogenase (NAD+)
VSKRPSRSSSLLQGTKGILYREPYGVTLIICLFNGPLLLSLRPATAAKRSAPPSL